MEDADGLRQYASAAQTFLPRQCLIPQFSVSLAPKVLVSTLKFRFLQKPSVFLVTSSFYLPRWTLLLVSSEYLQLSSLLPWLLLQVYHDQDI
jgi:hypothetical protein